MANEPLEPEWAFLPIEKVYEYNPVKDGTPGSIVNHIFGVQGNLWCEYVTCPNRLEYAVLPRMAAISEDAWTLGNKKNFRDFKARITRLTRLYDKKGLTYSIYLWTDRYNHDRENM